MPCIDDGCNGKYFGCWMFFRCQYPIIWHRFSCELTSDCVAHLNAFNPIFEPIFDDSRSLAGSIDILLKHPVFLGRTSSVNRVIFFLKPFHRTSLHSSQRLQPHEVVQTAKIECFAACASTSLFLIYYYVHLTRNFFLVIVDGIPNSSHWNANLFHNLCQRFFRLCWWIMMAHFSLFKMFIVALLYYLWFFAAYSGTSLAWIHVSVQSMMSGPLLFNWIYHPSCINVRLINTQTYIKPANIAYFSENCHNRFSNLPNKSL